MEYFMTHSSMIGIFVFGVSLAAQAGLGDAGIVRPLSELLDDTGWTQTPEFSGVFKVGSVFRIQEGGHGLMIRSCFEAIAQTDTYTSMEVVSQLQAGVSVRAGLFGGKASGEIVKRVRFGTPEHHTIERLAMNPTEECHLLLAKVADRDVKHMYAVSEVLTAEISEQTCGRINAKGGFVGLGKAEAELSAACSLESLEPVAVAMRTVPLSELLEEAPRPQTVVKSTSGCPWGGELSSLVVTQRHLTVNGRKLDMKGAERAAKVVDEVHRCGHPVAARALDAWQRNLRVSTISAYTVVGWYPFSVGLVASVRARKYRDLTERLLRDPNSVSQEELNKLMKR